ncbi:AtpZ/AtpI family protein [Acidimangrovimonas pyrenivorans]|uniref:AtpZ/AtpI family protein n=1 Tax=Acidimangrovimonas pyrenivorans TaxID=2030798 RepID=A0ABV7ACD5_9RHOB
MSDPDDDRDARSDEMHGAVQKRAAREARSRKEREPTVWENLSLIGALGWLIVVPPLLGGLLGRWLDRVTGHPILWSGLFIAAGVVIGAWLAWQKATRS